MYDFSLCCFGRTSEYLDIDVPEPSVQEQVAIAGSLSDIDFEVEMLEVKLSKVKLLKQAMMQQLLTGKIRLV